MLLDDTSKMWTFLLALTSARTGHTLEERDELGLSDLTAACRASREVHLFFNGILTRDRPPALVSPVRRRVGAGGGEETKARVPTFATAKESASESKAPKETSRKRRTKGLTESASAPVMTASHTHNTHILN